MLLLLSMTMMIPLCCQYCTVCYIQCAVIIIVFKWLVGRLVRYYHLSFVVSVYVTVTVTITILCLCFHCSRMDALLLLLFYVCYYNYCYYYFVVDAIIIPLHLVRHLCLLIGAVLKYSLYGQ